MKSEINRLREELDMFSSEHKMITVTRKDLEKVIEELELQIKKRNNRHFGLDEIDYLKGDDRNND